MNGARKGSSFERLICKKLSEWWSDGTRSDIFWRSSQSGGRATIRGRKGLRTAGSYGDIVALDPIGKPLLDFFTIELKCGRSHGEPGDILDCAGNPKCHAFIQTLNQARGAHKLACSRSWLLICKRDRRQAVAFFPLPLLTSEKSPFYQKVSPFFIGHRCITYSLHGYHFVGVLLDDFLAQIKPSDFPQKK